MRCNVVELNLFASHSNVIALVIIIIIISGLNNLFRSTLEQTENQNKACISCPNSIL